MKHIIQIEYGNEISIRKMTKNMTETKIKVEK